MSQQVNASLASTRPALPVSRLTIDGKAVDNAVFVELTVSKKVNQHDSAEISILWATTAAPDIERKTISFTYGERNRAATFYGYVYSTEKAQEFQKQTITRVSCLGATWVMRSVGPRLFANRTAQSMCEELVRPHGLGVRVPATATYVYPRFAQVDHTDWEALCEVAHLSGLYAAPQNGVVRLVDPVAELSVRSPWRQYNKSTTLLDPADIGLLDFSPANSVTTNRAHLQPAFSYFGSDGSLKTYVPTCDPVDVTQVPGRYVPDPKAAEQMIATMTQWNSLNQSAEARVRGDGTVNPGDTVSVRTGPSSTVVDDYDGMWFVSAVEHRIDSKSFQTNLKLARDKYRELDGSKPHRRFWAGDPNMLPQLSLVDGKWASNWRQ
jgi:hypothetical protein